MAKKKVKVTTGTKNNPSSGKAVGSKKVKVNTSSTKVKPTRSRIKSGKKTVQALTFDKENYKWMGIGLGLIFLGMLLMMGGGMSSPDVWDESVIYSFRRITLAPIVIIGGLGVVAYGIFK